MATLVTKQLYINEDNVKSYFSTDGGHLNGATIGGKYITLRSGSKTSTFNVNDSGLSYLFPNDSVIANKIEIWAQGIATSSGRVTLKVIANGNEVISETLPSSLTEYTGTYEGSFSKSQSSIQYVITLPNLFYSGGVRDTSITLSYYQYSCAAVAGGNGVASAAVSNTAPFNGESVTYTATLKAGAVWHGWYSDAAHTQLVSTDLEYSTAASDLTLYAYAEKEGTSLYYKQNGVYTEVQALYKKNNGVWISIEPTDLDQTVNYILKQ